MPRPERILRLLERAGADNQEQLDRLLPLVYEDLREVARGILRSHRPADQLQTTALVHEGYLALRGQRAAWQSHAHVVGVAATAMRRILVNRIEARQRLKHGGAFRRVGWREVDLARDDEEMVAVNDAIDRLAAIDARKARLVELRFFAGLTLREAARALDVSVTTAKRDWTFAKLWILRDTERGDERAP